MKNKKRLAFTLRIEPHIWRFAEDAVYGIAPGQLSKFSRNNIALILICGAIHQLRRDQGKKPQDLTNYEAKP
jgi:hypothetical protein